MKCFPLLNGLLGFIYGFILKCNVRPGAKFDSSRYSNCVHQVILTLDRESSSTKKVVRLCDRIGRSPSFTRNVSKEGAEVYKHGSVHRGYRSR